MTNKKVTDPIKGAANKNPFLYVDAGISAQDEWTDFQTASDNRNLKLQELENQKRLLGFMLKQEDIDPTKMIPMGAKPTYIPNLQTESTGAKYLNTVAEENLWKDVYKRPAMRYGGMTSDPPNKTKLNANQEFVFNFWKNSMPKNLQSDTNEYDLRGAWLSGMEPELVDDGSFHLGSRNPFTGEYLKAANHPSQELAIESDIKEGYTPIIDIKTGRMGSKHNSEIKMRYGGAVKAQNGFPIIPPVLGLNVASLAQVPSANPDLNQGVNPYLVYNPTANEQVKQQLDQAETITKYGTAKTQNLTPQFGESGTKDMFPSQMVTNTGNEFSIQLGNYNPFVSVKPVQEGESGVLSLANYNPQVFTQPVTEPNPSGIDNTNPLANMQKALMDAQIDNTTPLTGKVTPTTKATDIQGSKERNQKSELSDVTAQTYFGLLKGIDVASLIGNIMQAPPPNVQMPKTNLQRVDLDNTPFDTERAKIAEANNKSFRTLREGLSQASDLMKGVQAVSVNQQEALRNVGNAEAQQLNQERMINNEIQNKEQQLIDEQNKAEMLTNYQIQAEAQATKNKMITDSLENIKKDVMFEAQYNEQKRALNRQEEYDRKFIDKQQQIQLLTMASESNKGYDQTNEYLTGLKNKQMDYLNTVQSEMAKEYGDAPEFTKIDDNRIVLSEQKMKIDAAEKNLQTPPKAPAEDATEADKAQYEQQLKTYTASLADFEETKKTYEANKVELDRQQKYQVEFYRRFKLAGVEDEYRKEYMKEKGIMSNEEIQKRVASLFSE